MLPFLNKSTLFIKWQLYHKVPLYLFEMLHWLVLFRLHTQLDQYLELLISVCISPLIKGKLRNHQKVLKFFNGITGSASNLLFLFTALPTNFVLLSKYLVAVVFLLSILKLHALIFLLTESFTLFLLFAQTSWCHRIIVTIF